MEEIEDRVAIKVQALSDLELAVLVCLTANQHCIIETDRDLIDDVEAELQLVNADNSFHNETPAETIPDCTRCVWSLMYRIGLLGAHDA